MVKLMLNTTAIKDNTLKSIIKSILCILQIFMERNDVLSLAMNFYVQL